MARLPQGVIKRKNGTLQKRFTLDGKRYSIYGHTVPELLEKELLKRQEIERGLYKKNKQVILDDYFEEFIEQRSKFVKGNTIYKYKTLYKNHLKPLLGSHKVVSIERRECLKTQNTLCKKLTISTNNEVMKILKTILGNAVIDGIISENPMIAVKMLKDTNKVSAAETKHRALTEIEQRAFMQQLKEDNAYYYELIAFMLSTGMRYGECVALSWADIDTKNNVIHVNKTITKDVNGKQAIGTPKTKTSIRDIPMNDTIREVLRSQKKKCAIIYSTVPHGIDNRVFPSPYGNIPFVRQFNEDLKGAIKRVNEQGIKLEPFSSHCFRDTFATRFIEQGGTPQTLKTILGHSSLSMTMDLYAHVLPNTKAEEMNRITIVV